MWIVWITGSIFYRSSIVINLRGAGELPIKIVLAFVILDTLECEWEHTCLSYARTTHSNTWLLGFFLAVLWPATDPGHVEDDKEGRNANVGPHGDLPLELS